MNVDLSWKQAFLIGVVCALIAAVVLVGVLFYPFSYTEETSTLPQSEAQSYSSSWEGTVGDAISRGKLL